MLRKRTRSHHKEQHMGHLMSDALSESSFHSDVSVQKHKNNSLFNVPRLFTGLSPNGSESDSVRSPTSPLDFRVFSNLANPLRSRSSNEGHPKRWDCSKVGLSIIDSLDEETRPSGKILRSSDSKNILFGPQMRIKTENFRNCIDSFEAPKSLPKNISIFPYTQVKPSNLLKGNSDVLFEIGEARFEQGSLGKIYSCSVDFGRSGSHLANFVNHCSDLGSGNFGSANGTNPVKSPPEFIRTSFELENLSSAKVSLATAADGSGTGFFGSLPPSEIELSEDYTCVRTHGPNPKVTHIFGDCVLECHDKDLTSFPQSSKDGVAFLETGKCTDVTATSYPSCDFLSVCYSCKKKLDGEDIYMYRGEKAFCSCSCRSQEILNDEEMEETIIDSENLEKRNSHEELFESGLFIAT